MKKETIFRTVFLIIFIVFAALAVIRFQPVETRLLQGFIKPDSTKNEQLLKLSDLSSSKINIIFESEDYESVEKLKENFLSELKSGAIEIENYDFSEILEVYKNNPANFLTPQKRELLRSKNYTEIDKQSLETLYNPLGIFIQTPDKDPYLFVTDYVMSLQTSGYSGSEISEFEGKFYTKQQLSLKNTENSSAEIAQLLKLQKEFNAKNNGQIYITGTPVHSYITSQKSSFEINLICIISTIALILLCKFYFKSFKILVPIASSIAFGMFFGWLAVQAIAGSVHILTFVFSTTLIGISLDYSLHYIMTSCSKGFIKNLTASMLTTVAAFAVLPFSGIEILKEIAIFTGFGLFGVYAFVLLFFPFFKKFISEKPAALPVPELTKFKKIFIAVVLVVIGGGFLRMSFNDDIRNLYNPSKALLKAEILNKNAFQTPDISFAAIEGADLNSPIEKEEKTAEELDKKNIKYFSLSKLLPSAKIQLENQELVKNLYNSNLDKYAQFLDKKTRNELKLSVQTPHMADFGKSADKIIKNFQLDKNTLYMILFDAENFTPQDENVNYINISKDITKQIKNLRIASLKLLPCVFLILFVMLGAIFGFKKAGRIIISPFLGTFFAISVLSLTGQPLNFFNILAMFLITGFSLDYSIFRASGEKNSKDAVFISFISTAFSFLMLSFTSFKLISSLGTVLFLGITSSYILSLVLIPEKETEHM